MGAKALWLAALIPLILPGCRRAPVAAPAKPVLYARHACGGAPAGWAPQGTERGELRRYNRLDLGPSGMRWNDGHIDRPTLARYLADMAPLEPKPVMVLIVAPRTDCRAVVALRRFVDAGVHCATSASCVEYAAADWATSHPPLPDCDADCEAYGRAGGSDRGLSAAQKRRLKKNYIDRYGLIPW